jgi:hypothetical protein
MLLQLGQPGGRCQYALDFDPAIDMEIDPVEAPVGSAHLILRANSLLQQLLLNVDCVSGKRMPIAHSVLQSIKTEKEPNRKRRARTQSRPRRQVSHMMNFDSVLDAEELEAAAHRRMLNCIIPLDILNFRVGDTTVILKKGR